MSGQRRRLRRLVPVAWGAAGLVVVVAAVLLVGPTSAAQPAVARLVAARTTSAGVESVAFVGDSWTYGTGASDRRSYAVLTAEQLGWSATVLGIGGTGYSVPAGGATYERRIEQAVRARPDVLVVQGSLNERRSTPAALAAAADRTLARLRADADPRTRILVVGACYDPGTPDATIDWINHAIRLAAAHHGLRFVDPSTWIDPHDPSLWFDPIHPDDAGHQVMAGRLEPLVLQLVRG